MKNQIVMSPNNAACCVAIPLFQLASSVEGMVLDAMSINENNYSVAMIPSKPLAYALDFGEGCEVLSAEWVEKNLIFLGDL